MGMAFHKLLCEEMIFLLPLGKNDGLRYEAIIFSQGQLKYHFFTQKFVEMPHFKIRKWNFKKVLLKNDKSKNVLEIDVEKDGGIFF